MPSSAGNAPDPASNANGRSASSPTHTISLRAFGVRFSVGVDDPALLPMVLERVPPGSRVCRHGHASERVYAIRSVLQTTDQGSACVWRVLADGQLEAEEPSLDDALQVFEGVVRFDVARLAARWTFVHAGVVQWQGWAIVVPGLSFSGKTSLIEALVRAGAEYYSDEFAPLDRRGRVFPFAKPMTIRRPQGGADRVEPADIGGTTGTRPLRVGLVVATRYEPGATWQPESAADGGTVLALLTHTVRAQVAPARVLRTLAAVAAHAATLEGVRGEAEQTAAEVLQHLSARPTGSVNTR